MGRYLAATAIVLAIAVIAALEKHIETLKADEAIARTMREQAPGTEAAVLDVRFRRLEAEIRLNEEKAR